MKNKLFYLISAAYLLSYTGAFTSCVNGIDDEYLEQKITDTTISEDELPDLNGEYSMTGDFDLEMICNGDLLEGQKVVPIYLYIKMDRLIYLKVALTNLHIQ